MRESTITFEPTPLCDFTPLVRNALSNPGCTRIVFRPGRYDFHPELAVEKYLFISNNDEGLKRIAIPIFGREGFEIEATGARFVFHGGILPVAAVGCSALVLRGFSLDWEVPFHGEAEVLDADAAGVLLKIREGFSYQVRSGHLAFGGGSFILRNVLAFDARRRETAFQTRDNYGIESRYVARDAGERVVRLDARLSDPLPIPGDILALVDERRDYPGVFLDGCSDVLLDDVTIRHAGGMGVIGQCCSGLSLQRVTVAPDAQSGRMISTTADATHFVHCQGHVRLLDCVFENQMDDATNIHGIYAQVAGYSAADGLLVRLRHHQQFGVPFALPGHRLELARQATLASFHESVALGVEVLNKEFLRIRLAEPPSCEPVPGDVVANMSWNPEVEIRGCRSRGNRARGFLISSAGRVVIEDNDFHTPGAAILVASDARDWFESGPVRDLLIRRNRFETCNYGVWGKAAIQIAPRIERPDPSQPPYHGDIRIEDNTFTVFDPRIVFARSVRNLHITGNHIMTTDVYPPQNAQAPSWDVSTCQCVNTEHHPPAPDSKVRTACAAVF